MCREVISGLASHEGWYWWCHVVWNIQVWHLSTFPGLFGTCPVGTWPFSPLIAFDFHRWRGS